MVRIFLTFSVSLLWATGALALSIPIPTIDTSKIMAPIMAPDRTSICGAGLADKDGNGVCAAGPFDLGSADILGPDGLLQVICVE